MEKAKTTHRHMDACTRVGSHAGTASFSSLAAFSLRADVAFSRPQTREGGSCSQSGAATARHPRLLTLIGEAQSARNVAQLLSPRREELDSVGEGNHAQQALVQCPFQNKHIACGFETRVSEHTREHAQ